MHGTRVGLGALLLIAVGCSKNEGSGTATAVPSEAPTISITGTPPPAPSAAANGSAAVAVASATASGPTAVAAAPAVSAVPSASVKPSAKAGAAALAASAAKPELPPLKPAATSVSGKNFTLAVASPGCRVDVPCSLTLRLTAGGEFHVNKEYPYKFTASAAPGVAFLGSGDANVFSRAAGDFREDGEKTATMTVRFKPSTAGEAHVAGAYKMSVCSAEQCQIETQAVQLAVPVL